MTTNAQATTTEFEVFYLPSPNARATELRTLTGLGPASGVRELRLRLTRALGTATAGQAPTHLLPRGVLCMRAMYSPATMWDSLEPAVLAGMTLKQAGIDETVVVTIASSAEAGLLGILLDTTVTSTTPITSDGESRPKLSDALAQSFVHDEQSLAPIVARDTQQITFHRKSK